MEIYSNNAYLNGCSLSMTAESTAVTANIAWLTGPLGFFYQPANSPLINVGNLPAVSLGLYHYTTQKNEAPETNTIVDIGYHYIALDATGNPIDSSASGVPDYVLAPYCAVVVKGDYINNGLQAYWKLKDGVGSTTAADSSGNGITMSLENGPFTWGANYLTFNSEEDQYGDAGTSPLEIVGHEMTVCGWINKIGSSEKGIIDKSFNPAVGAGGWGFWINNNQQIEFSAQITESDSGGTMPIPLGQWEFVAAVLHIYAYGDTDNSVNFYVNGILDSYPESGSLWNYTTLISGTPSADLQLGNKQDNSSSGLYAFDGSLRNVAVYDRALSDAEIGTNFIQSAGGITNILVPYPDLLYYKMNEFNPADPTIHPFSLTDSSLQGETTGTYEGVVSTIWTSNPEGLVDTALHFSGAGAYIDTGNSALFNFTTNSFTINVWVNPYNRDGYIMGNNSYLANGWFMSVDNFARLYFGSETSDAESVLYSPNPIHGWPTSLYNMVTVTRNGTSTPLVYINGQLQTMNGSFTSPASSANSLKFGVGVDGNGNYPLDGNIWLPQIWSTNLSQQQIAILYLEQSKGYSWP